MKKWIITIVAVLLMLTAISVGAVYAGNGSNAKATVTAEQATAAALDANTGTTAKATELNNENGNLVWGVELSNGAEAKVDAGDVTVLRTEQPDPNEPEGESKESVEEQGKKKPDTDNVQEGNQKDDERGETESNESNE